MPWKERGHEGPGHAEDLAFDRFHRHAGWDRVIADRAVCNSPCYLLNLCICSDAGGAGVGALYNGNSLGGKHMIDFAVLNGQWQDWPIRHPIFFSNGLFVNVGVHILSIFVHYLPVPE